MINLTQHLSILQSLSHQRVRAKILAHKANERREGITEIALSIHDDNPTWDFNRVLCAAKVEWHHRNPISTQGEKQ